MPQTAAPAQRTARVLQEVIESRRSVDIERLVNRDIDDDQPGDPLGADDVAVPVGDAPEATPEKVSFRVSEPWVGGCS